MREYKAPKFQEYLGLLEEIVELGRQSGEFREDLDPRITKRVLFGALDEVSLYWVSTRRKPYSLERAAEEILSICASGVFSQQE